MAKICFCEFSVPVSVLKSCVLAARPKTLPAAVVPVWVGCVLSWRVRGCFDGWLALWTLLGAVAIQIATNFLNDAIDAKKGADTERRLGPVRMTASGQMSPAAVMGMGMVFLALATVCGAFLLRARGWPMLVIGVPSLFFAYGYTGGPFPLAYRGMGEVFVILFFGFVAVMGTVFVQTGEWLREGFWLGAQVGLLSAVLISINNFRDRPEDETTEKRTLAVRGGELLGKGVIFLEVILAILVGVVWWRLGVRELVWVSGFLLGMGGWIVWRVAGLSPGPRCNRLLAMAGVQLILFAVLFQVAVLI